MPCMLCVRNYICLGLALFGASACDMMRDEGDTAQQQHQWFEYAYYSSPAELEADGMSKQVLDYNKARMRIY